MSSTAPDSPSHSHSHIEMGDRLKRGLLEALIPHAPRLVPAIVAMLLVTEAILALVVIFSRMSALQQFICVVLIVVLPATVLALAAYMIARISKPPVVNGFQPAAERFPSLEAAPWTPASYRSASSADSMRAAATELSILVEQMEEMTLRTRRLPFNIVIGLNEEQFTYWLVKLRAASDVLTGKDEQRPAIGGLLGDGAPILQMRQLDKMQEEVRGRAPAMAVVEKSESRADPAVLKDSPSIGDARAALRSGETELAIRELKDLLLLDADDSEAAELLGVAYERAGDMDAALEAMRVAVLTDPKRSSSHYNYAVLLGKAERLLDAYRQNEVALRLNPDYAAARELQKSLHAQIVARQRTAASSAPQAISS